MNQSPNILITNDDGIHAPGIYALWEAMSKIGNVTVVAPDSEKSAVGHAITLSNPIRIQEIERHGGFTGYAVNGTPADCVKIGFRSLVKESIDLIVSGINAGANVGTDIIYSGTVSAATEGVFYHIPSIAFSLDALKGGDFGPSKMITQNIVRALLKNGIPKGTLLNVNIPNLPLHQIKGARITEQGDSSFRDCFEKREDPRGRIYYWMSGEVVNPNPDPDMDINAVNNGYVSITPIHYKLTNQEFLPSLKKWDVSW